MIEQKRPYGEALAVAHDLVTRLRPGCERIELAGSLRRRTAEVGDIEIVAIPTLVPVIDMFGLTTGERASQLDEQLARLEVRLAKDGPAYKQFVYQGFQIDLFVQRDPATWGLNFTLRTGCAEFSQWLVTSRRQGGGMPAHLKVRDARIWLNDQPLDTREEPDVFSVVGLEWIEPEERTPALVARKLWRR